MFIVFVFLCAGAGYYKIDPNGWREKKTAPEPATFYPVQEQTKKIDETIPKTISITVGSGDTVAKMLSNQGINKSEIHNLIEAMSKNFKPNKLRPEHDVEITKAKPENDAEHFEVHEMRIRPSIEYSVVVTKDDQGCFKCEKEPIPLIEETRFAEGEIESSLYESAAAKQIPPKAIHELIAAFSYDVDFQRSLHSGDKYQVMYSIYTDPETGKERLGEVKFATLIIGDKPYAIYKFAPRSGVPGYYNDKGESVVKALLRTPIDGARLSSHYGKRKHPVLGYTKHHKGVDFAAPRGTPIMAAGSGVVDKIGRWGAYGMYVRIRHTNKYSTAYAHLSAYAKNLKKGSKVTQGQVIGYVGATGRTTGAHLHYEILVNLQQVNPMSVKMLPSNKLNAKDLPEFKKNKLFLDRYYAELKNGKDTRKEIVLAMSDHT